MAGSFELKVAKDGQFFFSLVAGNGQKILASEMYKTKAAAQNGIASIQKNCGEDKLFERKESTNGKPYFVLKAKNHQIIGQSQMYETAAACENGIESVKKNGCTENVKDMTAG